MSRGGTRLRGKVALITGAAGGLGRAQAIRFAQEGAACVLCDQASAATELGETSEQVHAAGGEALVEHTDVRRLTDVEAAVEAALGRWGALHVVCANAGIWSSGPTASTTTEEWQRVIDVNLTGAWHTAKAAVPAMTAAGTGSIIVTSSIAAIKGTANMAAYVASKSGLVGMVRSLANELGQHGIRVNAILPGLVATPMVLNETYLAKARPDLTDPQRADLEQASRARNALRQGMLEPIEIAHAALWLASDEARFVTGVALPVDSGAVIA